MVLSVGLPTLAAASDKPEDRTILNPKSLSFVVGDIGRFLGQREQPLALHRILGIDQSLAMTRVRYNNRLVLINPHRVLFDQFGFVNTGEFLATTLRVRGSHETVSVVNSSSVDVSEHGYIAFTTPGVKTEAVVIAGVTTSPSDAERKLLFDFMSDGLIRYAIGESELDQFTGVDGKALAQAYSEIERHEAVPGQMLVNARSAADIQRSVMNLGNVPRARRLVVENGSIRLEGERPLLAMRRPASNAFFKENPDSEPVRQVLQTHELPQPKITIAMVNPMSSSLQQDPARVPDHKSKGADGVSLTPNQVQSRKPALEKKPSHTAIQKARQAEGKSGSKGKTKTQKTSPLSRADQVQSTPWSSIPGGLPEWMKYLPKTEGTENPAIP